MYEFHYKYTGKTYDNFAKLLFTETDSLVYEIETDHVDDDFYENKNLFDFKDYLEDSTFFHSVNKKIIVKMKEEVEEKIISEFVGLKSKMYSLVTANNEEIKKAKVSIKMLLKT